MLADRRSCFLLSFLLAFSVATCLPVPAQINGVPPSATSFGFGGSNNPNPGFRASATSLGQNGFGSTRPVFGSCCANYFRAANPNPSLFFDRPSSGRRHRHDEHNFFPVGVIEPAYVPYAIPYPVPYAEDADDAPPDADSTYSRVPRNGPRNPDSSMQPGDRDAAARDDASANPAPSEPAEPVVAQPSTVLVFKDGHQSNVLNYAIVGDTLFDFGDGRTRKILLADLDLPATHKANDERGVDFQIPARKAQP